MVLSHSTSFDLPLNLMPSARVSGYVGEFLRGINVSSNYISVSVKVYRYIGLFPCVPTRCTNLLYSLKPAYIIPTVDKLCQVLSRFQPITEPLVHRASDG